MVDDAGMVGRLRARREEIEEAIFGRVREVVWDPVASHDAEYATGLRAAIAAAVELSLAGLEGKEARPVAIPAQAVAQAHRAARSGVSLDAVLRRYIVGHALLWDYIMEEADRAGPAGQGRGLREMLRAQASLLDQLVIGVAREHTGELKRAGRSREQQTLERTRALLAGAHVDTAEFDYQFDAEHLGMIAKGARRHEALKSLARDLDRRLLSVAAGEGTVWAWLGGPHALKMADLQHAFAAQTHRLADAAGGPASCDPGVSLAVGEPARGLGGWRLTHRQAQATLLVALRKPQPLTRYGDVALLAAALKDDTLARSLMDHYLSPLDGPRGAGQVLRQTLRAYLAAERNASSAAAALGVVRNTVENRLRTIEERLGRPLHQCLAELEIALRLDELGLAVGTADASTGCA